ncbi:early nodulin-like protein 1 [Miscanthus floridulus]|uniref:early nodulin-like protein 1 n=1 Tax=Miscanthus floridulus TaxID=154761 RepID=UPI003458BEDD
MGRPRATPAAATSRPRRNPKPKPDSSFLSPLASPSATPRTRTRTRTRKGAIRGGGPSPVSSSPGSSPADLNISFLSSPGSASPPKPKPKLRSRAKPKPKPKPDPSFLSPLTSPSPSPAPRTRKRAVRGVVGSSPASSSPGSSPADLSISFLSSPGSPASPPKPSARAKFAARAPLVASPRAATPSPAASPHPASVGATGVSSVGDLRTVVASQMENLKRRLDALHSRAHADLDASFSRVSKRIKTQNQACQQLADEVDKEHKKISDNMKESSEIARAKYKQIIAEAQASTTRVWKVTIPEMTKSVEKAIDGLCTHYNISMPV